MLPLPYMLKTKMLKTYYFVFTDRSFESILTSLILTLSYMAFDAYLTSCLIKHTNIQM